MKAAILIGFAAAACSPYNPDLGASPYKCAAAEPKCPGGYTCDTNNNCVAPGGSGPDSGSNDFQCIDDSGFGMNDTIQGAFQTPIAASNTMFSVASAICPEGDKDTYKLDVDQAHVNANVQVTVFWDSGMALNAAILNAGGTPIGNGAPGKHDDNGTMKDASIACVPNLPVGTYYAQAFGPATVKNNYHLIIALVPNC